MKVTAIARRSGGWWAIEVPEVAGVFTQARRLDQVAGMTADAVAMMLDTDAGTVDVTVEAHTSRDPLIAAARAARETAMRAADEASAILRTTARELIADGLTIRDAGHVMGISHQRVSQLVASSTPREASPRTADLSGAAAK